MIDGRISLWDLGIHEVQIGDTSYRIDSAPERGATCLVYHAHRQEKVGEECRWNRVLLKEFYPLLSADLGNGFQRQEDGKLLISDYILESEEYKLEWQRFGYAYKVLLELRSAEESAEFLPAPVGWFEDNGTCYRVESYDSGHSFAGGRNWTFCFDFHIFMEHFSKCIMAVGKLHDRGYLHLDLKPQNVSITNDDNIKLFDTDTFVKRSDLGSPMMFMVTEGYSAPELRSAARHYESARNLIGPWTDVYSLTQFVCWYLFGRPLSEGELDEQLEKMEDIIMDRFNYVNELSFKGLFRLKLLLKKNLSFRYKKRCQDVGELLMELRQVERFMHNHYGEPNDNFREWCGRLGNCPQELERLEESIELSDGVALISSEQERRENLARAYATKHRLDYSDIIEVFCDSFEDLYEKIRAIPPSMVRLPEESSPEEDSVFRRKLSFPWDLQNPHDVPLLFLIFDQQEKDKLKPEEAEEISQLLRVTNSRTIFIGKTDRCWKWIDGTEENISVDSIDLDQHRTNYGVGRKHEWASKHALSIHLTTVLLMVISVLSAKFTSLLAEKYLIDMAGNSFQLASWWRVAGISLFHGFSALLGTLGLTVGIYAFNGLPVRKKPWNFIAEHRIPFTGLWSMFLALFTPGTIRDFSELTISSRYGMECDLIMDVINVLLIVFVVLMGIIVTSLWIQEAIFKKAYGVTVTVLGTILLILSGSLLTLQSIGIPWLLIAWLVVIAFTCLRAKKTE